MAGIISNFFSIKFQLILWILCALYLWVFSAYEDENLLAKRILVKLSNFGTSLSFMIYSKDTKGLGPKYNRDPDLIKDFVQPKSISTGTNTLDSTTTTSESDSSSIKVPKTLVFIRHGESDWNNIFNKGFNVRMIVTLVKSLINEIVILPLVHSIFLDSPLNHEGIDQALELRRYISSSINDPTLSPNVKQILEVLRNGSNDPLPSSIIVSSTLRRAIATTVLGLWDRLSKTGEQVHLLSSLQEISRNVDTFALSPANGLSDLPDDRVSPHCEGYNPAKLYNVANNFGNKNRSFYGMKRLLAFNEWAFKQSEDIIIVGGHSLWFKQYFNTFLPHSCKHEARTKKIQNSGIVSLKVYDYVDPEDGVTYYRVDPDSIEVVYGGFTTK